MGRIDDLLLLEKAGELPPELQGDLDLLRKAGEVPGGSTESTEPATMTKTAAPAAPQPEGFFGHLSNEFTSGISQAYNAAADPRPISGPLDPKALNVPLGLLRAAASPITAAGHAAGESVLDTTLPMMGPTGAAITATIADLGTQFMASPQAVAKAAPKATQALQWMAGKLPGAQLALRELGKKTIEAWPSALRPARSADDLFAELRTMNPKVELPSFQNTARKIVVAEDDLAEFGLSNTQLASTAASIKSTLKPPPGLPSQQKQAAAQAAPLPKIVMGQSGYRGGPPPSTTTNNWRNSVTPANFMGPTQPAAPTGPITREIPFQQVEKIRQRIGARIGELRVTGGEELGTYKQLFRSLSEDLDKSASQQVGEAFTKLKEANAAAKTEFAIGQLDDIFDATMGRALEGRSITSSSFAQALNKVKALRKKDELFEQGIGAGNLDKIESRLNDLRQLKILPPPASANVGSYQRVGQATVGGAVAHHVLGTDPVTSMAIGLGVPWVISRAVQSKAGTKLLEGFLQSGGQLDPKSIAAIVGAVRLDDPKTKEFLKSFPDVMQSANIPTEVKMKQAMEKHKLTQEVQVPGY